MTEEGQVGALFPQYRKMRVISLRDGGGGGGELNQKSYRYL